MELSSTSLDPKNGQRKRTQDNISFSWPKKIVPRQQNTRPRPAIVPAHGPACPPQSCPLRRYYPLGKEKCFTLETAVDCLEDQGIASQTGDMVPLPEATEL